MLGLFCTAHHGAGGDKGKMTLCRECSELLAYTNDRLARCPHGRAKPVCARCLIHCYRPPLRTRMAAVMREQGPRLLWHRPLLALLHLLDGLRRGRFPPRPR